MADTQMNGDSLLDVDVDVEMKEEDSGPQVAQPLDSVPTDLTATPQPETVPVQSHVVDEPAATTATPSIDPAPASHVQFTATAPSIRNDSTPPQASTRPEKPVAHGGPTRQYLNTNVTPHLLEAMKHLAVHEPEKPLLWLADFLRDRSKEIEGA